MTQRALVYLGRCVDLRPLGGDFPVSNAMQWVDAPDMVEIGWSYDGVGFAAPPTEPPDPVPTKEELIAQIFDNAASTDALKQVVKHAVLEILDEMRLLEVAIKTVTPGLAYTTPTNAAFRDAVRDRLPDPGA